MVFCIRQSFRTYTLLKYRFFSKESLLIPKLCCCLLMISSLNETGFGPFTPVPITPLQTRKEKRLRSARKSCWDIQVFSDWIEPLLERNCALTRTETFEILLVMWNPTCSSSVSAQHCKQPKRARNQLIVSILWPQKTDVACSVPKAWQSREHCSLRSSDTTPWLQVDVKHTHTYVKLKIRWEESRLDSSTKTKPNFTKLSRNWIRRQTMETSLAPTFLVRCWRESCNNDAYSEIRAFGKPSGHHPETPSYFAYGYSVWLTCTYSWHWRFDVGRLEVCRKRSRRPIHLFITYEQWWQYVRICQMCHLHCIPLPTHLERPISGY